MFKVRPVATPILLHNIALIQMCHHAKAPNSQGPQPSTPTPDKQTTQQIPRLPQFDHIS